MFDVLITYYFLSIEGFGINTEGNQLIRNLMEQYGIEQGLALYVVQEFVIFFTLWGVFFLIMIRLIKGTSSQFQCKIDLLIFNIGAPFIIMASALSHFFGGLFWLIFGITGSIDVIDPSTLIIYITILCGMFQTYQLYNIKINQSELEKEN